MFWEVSPLDEHRLTVRSITYAVKAQKILSRYRISCRIVRDRSLQKGCGYLIIVRGNLSFIQDILQRNGIHTGKEQKS